MKNLLKELGFEDEKGVYLPKLSKFWKRFKTRNSRGVGGEFKFDDYVNFILQPVEKSMFVPCDSAGNVIDEPRLENKPLTSTHVFELRYYHEALENVIFDGWSVGRNTPNHLLFNGERILSLLMTDTIEDAIDSGIKIYLK